MQPTTFADPAESSAASYTPDQCRINATDDFSVVISKSRDALSEAFALLLEIEGDHEADEVEWLDEIGNLLRDALSFIDEPVVKVSQASGALREVLASIVESDNPRLEAECMGLAVGLMFTGNSMNAIAKAHGISRQAVSRRVRDYQEEKGINSAIYNKRAGSRAGYASGNHRRTKLEPIPVEKSIWVNGQYEVSK